jgi:predicted Zn-dependent protease
MIPAHELAERALAAAGALDGAVAIVRANSRADLRWARTTLTTNGESRGVDLTLIGFRKADDGAATATLSVSQPGAQEIAELVAAVSHALSMAPAAPDGFRLVDATDEPAADWADPVPYTSSDALSYLAGPLGEVFKACVADDIELFGYAEHSLVTTWLASSTGLRRRHCQPAARLEITAKSHGRERSSWWGVAGEDFAQVDLEPGERALRRGLAWQARQVQVGAGRHRALLTPSAVGDLMVDLWWSATAREAVEGRSVFSGSGGSTRIGSRLSDRAIRLVSDPADPDAPAADFLAISASSDAASVFDNGLRLGRVDWIQEGKLAALHSCRRFAADHGLASTASPDTLRLEDAAGAGGLDEIISRTQDALLVTCLWYNRLVDPQTLLLTGLTRDGVYLIRDGEVVGATTNFRFNDSPVSVLARMSDVGQAERTLPREMGDYAERVVMPAVTIEDFHFSTPSDAR